MTVGQAIFLFSAAVLGGALNSVAGGGGFLCFPALLLTGMPPINANATNTAALWPGTVGSMAAYRNVIREHRHLLGPLALTGVTGGLVGAVVLLRTPQATFLSMVPWLLLSATLLLTFSDRVTAWIRARKPETGRPSAKLLAAAALIQLCVALYIGFFGAGAGILMMALFAILGVQSIHALNGLKTTLATITNGIALLTFLVAGAVWWAHAGVMVVGAAIGGFGGAWLAQRMSQRYVRAFAIATGFTMSAYFFVFGGR